MEKKIGLFMNVSMSIIIAAVFSAVGQLVANGTVDWDLYPSTFLLSSVVAFLCVTFIPVQKWGAALAAALKCVPSSLPFAMVQNTVMVCIMLPIVMVCVNIYVVHFLFGAPMIAAILSALPGLPILLPIAWIIAMVVGPLCLKLAVRILGTGEAA